MLLLASLAVLALLAALYGAACAAAPFRRSGRLRYGRRVLNAWRRTHTDGTR